MPEQNTLVKPDVPESIPNYISEGLQKQDVATLRDLAAYAERLADHKEATTKREIQTDAVDEESPEEWDDNEWADQLAEARETGDIPASKGTLTTKKIDGRNYYYLQWREGGNIRSQYVAPTSPSG